MITLFKIQLKETVILREIPRDLDNMQFKVKVSDLNFGIPMRIKNLTLEQCVFQLYMW